MPSLKELMDNENIENVSRETLDNENIENVSRETIQEMPQPRGINILEKLKTPTGEGELETYREHVLNFNNSNAMSRIIRGLSGFVGNMNYAIVDIIIGMLEMNKGKGIKKNVN